MSHADRLRSSNASIPRDNWELAFNPAMRQWPLLADPNERAKRLIEAVDECIAVLEEEEEVAT